jgi:hypothetical protein
MILTTDYFTQGERFLNSVSTQSRDKENHHQQFISHFPLKLGISSRFPVSLPSNLTGNASLMLTPTGKTAVPDSLDAVNAPYYAGVRTKSTVGLMDHNAIFAKN